MGRNPSYFKGAKNPVEKVSWNDAVAFCNAISKTTGKAVRFVAAAGWEYTCNAGTTTTFNTGQTISTDQANYDGNYTYGNGRRGLYCRRTLAVSGFKPNAFGL